MCDRHCITLCRYPVEYICTGCCVACLPPPIFHNDVLYVLDKSFSIGENYSVLFILIPYCTCTCKTIFGPKCIFLTEKGDGWLAGWLVEMTEALSMTTERD